MTEILSPINIEENRWIELAQRSNELYAAMSNNIVSTGNPVDGDIELIGQLFAEQILESNSALITTSTTITTSGGLIGGGNLNSSITISLEPSVLSNINKAATALQPGDLDNFIEDTISISVDSGMIGGGRLNTDVAIELDANTRNLISLADTALQPGDVTPGYELGSIIYTTRVIGVVPYDISKLRYLGISYNITNRASAPHDLFFKPDGTKMYITDAGSVSIQEYDLNIPWNVSSAVWNNKVFNTGSQDSTPVAVSINSDGTKMLMLGNYNDRVYQYHLTTPWDISTANYETNFPISSRESNPFGMFVRPDGTKMYIVGAANKSVVEFDLSAPWSVSNAVYVATSLSLSSQESIPRDIHFNSDGTKMFILGDSSDKLHEYSLSTPWSVSTAVYLRSSKLITNESNPLGMFVKPDGTKMYIVGGIMDTIYEYSFFEGDMEWKICDGTVLRPSSNYPELKDLDKLPYYEPWDISITSYSNKSFLVSGQDGNPYGITFKPDGTKMYIIGVNNIRVYEYNLTTAWDISTAVYTGKSFLVSGQDGTPAGLSFKPDGTKMYIIGATFQRVYEYDLSTPWDISTAVYTGKFIGVSSQDTNPYGIFFKPDGSKMYIVGSASDRVYEYDLSTPWDISTAVYTGKSFLASGQDSVPRSISFKPDGTKMYMVGHDNKRVYEYDLSTPWDISTAVYTGKSFLVSGQDGVPYGIFFKLDGTKMYMVGVASDRVHEYDLDGIKLPNIQTPDASVYPYLKVTP